MIRARARLWFAVIVLLAGCGPKQTTGSGPGPDKIVVPYEAPSGQPPPVGSVAGDFALPDQDGKLVRLSELVATHKSVAVIFYRGHW